MTISDIYAQNGIYRNNNRELSEEQDYYFLLTEATKLYLFGQIFQAVNIYKQCLILKPESPAVNYRMAEILYRAGNITEAKKYAYNAYINDNENIWYAQLLAALYEESNNLDSAAIIFMDLLSKRKEDIDLLLKLSEIEEKRNNYDQALIYLNQIDNIIGLTKEVNIAKYRILLKNNKRNEALNSLYGALKISNEDYTILGILAEHFRDIGLKDSASYYYNRIYDDHKDDPAVCFSYGEFLLSYKDNNRAQKVFLDYLTNNVQDLSIFSSYLYSIINEKKKFDLISPIIDTVSKAYFRNIGDDPRYISIYVDIQLKLNHYLDASKGLKMLIIHNNDNYSLYEQLLFCYTYLNQKDSIVKYAEITGNKFKGKPISFLILGNTLYSQKEFNKAVEILENGLKCNMDDKLRMSYYSSLAESYMELKEYELAYKYFENALIIDPKQLSVRNNYAYYLAIRNERLDYAENLSKLTILNEPDNASYLDTYGWIMYIKGYLKKAKKYVEKAIEIGNESEGEVLYHYAEILFKLGKKSEALIYYNKAKAVLKDKSIESINERIAEIQNFK